MLYKLFRIILYPLLRFVIPVFSKKAKERLHLELTHQNFIDVDFIFHVSSEGELEQCHPLLLDLLKEGRVLLLFTSDSVLKKALELSLTHKNLYIEMKRIVSYFPLFNKGISKYKNVKKFFMVRYDFFPELISFSYNTDSTLLNASLINKDTVSGISKLMLKHALKSFNRIVYSSESEVPRFKKMGIHSSSFSFDLRSLRILKRKEEARTKLNNSLCNFFDFEKLNFSKVVVLGSYWNSEFPMLKDAIKESLNSNHLLFIAPHSLKSCSDIQKSFSRNEIKSIIVDSSTDLFDVYKKASKNNMAIILNLPGILCELYSVSDNAYIAGGWHKSIHSVLEPFLMNDRAFVSCGPNISRSTEFELATSIDSKRISSFKSIDQFQFLGENYEGTIYNVTETYIKLKEFIK